VEDVVVWVSTAPRGRPGAQAAIIDQKDLTILPHVTAVTAGTEIRFPNDDEVFHNLFSLSDAKKFNLGRYAPGESRSLTFDTPGIVRLFCDIHSDMGGVILVLESGSFARPDAEGRFTIAGLPSGTHTVVAWHESAGVDSLQVEVPEGGSAQVEFTLGG